MNEMRRGRGSQFDPDALDAFLRLVDKGVIDLDKIAERKKEELSHVKQDAELTRRVEEDKRIQEAEMHKKPEGEEKKALDEEKKASDEEKKTSDEEKKASEEDKKASDEEKKIPEEEKKDADEQKGAGV